jgi:hypothetical protein
VALSVISVGILLISYQRQQQNILLRSCCLVLLFMYAAICAFRVAPFNENACEIQAIFLNYCFICIHAHAAFMMLNNCYVAMGWKWRVFEQYLEREATLVLISYTLPMTFIASFAFMKASTAAAVMIKSNPFYCSVVRPRFFMDVMWFLLFGIPGSALAGISLICTPFS